MGQRTLAVDTLVQWARLDRAVPPARRPVARAEALELAAMPGAAIGAHSVHHLFLPSQLPDVQRAELSACRAALADALGREIRLFAYPYGGVDDGCASLARELAMLPP